MIDPKNIVSISGGLTRDPEIINDSIAKFGLAVDFAGSEKGSDNNAGYFDVTYYLNDGGKNADFVKNQINNGTMKKGSSVQIMGRLVQERWAVEDRKASKVIIVAEAVTYAGRAAPKTETDTNQAKLSTVPDF